MVSQYKKEFSNYLSVMDEALQNDDFASYRVAKSLLEESVEEYKHSAELLEEMNTDNFGILNNIFETELPRLILTNKKAIGAVMKTIREDRNLYSEFNFYNSLKQYKGSVVESVGASNAVDSLVNATNSLIDKKTIRESNKKLRKVMAEHNVKPSKPILKEEKELYENGHTLLTSEENIQNVLKIAEAKQKVTDYIERHKAEPIRGNIHPVNLIRDFEDKLKERLTESEISFVQQIVDFRTPMAEQRKEKLFNALKNECVKKIDEMLEENKDNEELKALRKQISEQTFNKDNIIQDVAKLLEIRDILLEK